MQDTTSSPRLHILQISPRIPWPVSDGSAIGIYNITRSVAARGHHITFVAFAPQVDPREQREDVVGDMPDFCELETVVHDTRNTPWKVLRNLFSPLPYPVSKYEAPEMYAQLDALCTERHFDVLHVDHAHMACYGEYVRKRYGIPYVLREHNFETTIYRRYVEQAQFLPARMYFNMQSSRLYRFEATALRHPDVIAAITPEDARAIHDALASVSGQTEQDEIPSRQEGVNPGVGRETRSTAEMKGKNRITGMDAPAEEAARPLEGDRARVRVIPAGVDIERHRPFDEGCDDAHVVLVGSLAWAPNSDAAQWFVTSIWPHISAA
ncbi:MAG: glycosyltransferase, partial [Bacteroidetes bacterium]|nr:glycosyltransferase [Bacteroidota bacterium]